ncbi:SPOR domain-containing protein [Sphingomonas sp.]|uniref:SPOR domain-containing protein n=1 Tax=Sphingomonas sp. TaxID=28214 RepID=UPI003B00FC10
MRGLCLMAASMALGGVSPASAQSVKDGVDAWQRGDYPAAVRSWRPLAEKGDRDAAFDLAQAYKLGRGVPTDMAQAKQWYGTAAKAGHPQGIANYGLLLFQDGQRREAMPWVDRASTAGDPRAQYVMGTALFNGDLTPKDWPRAYALMTRAGAAGLPQATTSLAQMDRFLSVADKAKGRQLASAMAAQPMPPIGRQLVTAAGLGRTAEAPPPTQVADATPPVKAGTAKPAKRVAAAAEPTPAKATPGKAASTKSTVANQKSDVAKPAAIATGGSWQVQLGAFGSEAAAKTAWASLSGKAPALKALRPTYGKAGAMVRLRAAGLSDRAAADRACAAAKAAGAACFAVPGGA